MTVQATGDILHYQWQKDGIDLSDDSRHHGTGTDTLRIVKVEKGDSKARYQCSVKNEVGVKFSKEAVLTVSKLVVNVVACVHGPDCSALHAILRYSTPYFNHLN